MTLQNAPQVFGDIERLKTKQQNGGLTKDEQINLHHAENLLARTQVTNLEAKQKALSKLPTPRDLHSTELAALAKAKAMLASPWPGTASAPTTQSSSGPLPPEATSTTHGVTPPTGTATGNHAGTADTTGSTTSTASSGDTAAPGSGTHTTNGVTPPPVGHGNRIPEDTTNPEHIDLAKKRVENLGKIAAKRKLDPHEQGIYDNALRVRDRNSPPPTGSRNTGNPDDLAMAGDEDALVPVTPDGEDAHLDAAEDAPPPAAPSQPANAIGTTINGPATPTNPNAPTASQRTNDQTNPQSKNAPNNPPAKLTAKSVKPGQSGGKSPPTPGKPPAGGASSVPPGKSRPTTPPVYNKTHKNSQPVPKGFGVNGGQMQSHHGLQQKWAIHNLAKYGYNPELAPTITLETGTDLQHTIITNLQNDRRDDRISSGKGAWSSTLQEELGHITSDLTAAGFSRHHILKVLEQQYSMLDKLKIPYKRIKY